MQQPIRTLIFTSDSFMDVPPSKVHQFLSIMAETLLADIIENSLPHEITINQTRWRDEITDLIIYQKKNFPVTIRHIVATKGRDIIAPGNPSQIALPPTRAGQDALYLSHDQLISIHNGLVASQTPSRLNALFGKMNKPHLLITLSTKGSSYRGMESWPTIKPPEEMRSKTPEDQQAS